MKKILLFFLTIHFSINIFSQLDKVAPLTGVIHEPAKVEHVNLLLSTKDFTSTFFWPQQDKYSTTVQLVHASNPFPPIWYQIGTDTIMYAGKPITDFFLNPQIQERTGHLSYNFTIVGHSFPNSAFDGYVLLDSSTLLTIDTLKETSFSLDSLYQALDNHEYEEDSHGNKLLLSLVKTKIDARCLSGNPADSLMSAIVSYVVVLDSTNTPVFIWNPLKYISPCEMHWEWRNSSVFYPGSLNWSHGNSVRWSNDGNILYSLRHIGIGKINSTTGDIMFKLGGKDSTHAIPLPDSIGYSLQHDFYQRPDGLYSLFSNGDDSIRPYMEGMVYDIDEIHKTVQLVYRYKPQPNCKSRALGGFDRFNNMYFLNRGMDFCFSTNQMVDIINENDQSPVAEIFGPKNNFSYRAHPTLWNISRRPAVTVQTGSITTDSISGLYGYTWYKVTDTSAVMVGSGLNYSPVVSGKYVVEARTGSGTFTSFLLSDPVNYIVTGIKNSVQNKISVMYNTMSHTATINLHETNGLLKILNVNGQEIKEVILTSNRNEIYFRNDPGIYIFDITTSDDHIVYKVFVN